MPKNKYENIPWIKENSDLLKAELIKQYNEKLRSRDRAAFLDDIAKNLDISKQTIRDWMYGKKNYAIAPQYWPVLSGMLGGDVKKVIGKALQITSKALKK